MDIRAYNSRAWDKEVEKGNKWTLPVGPRVIAEARKGKWEIVLTPQKTVPKDWFPTLTGCKVLCLACGGGQQGPVLSAAGAEVTVLDNSPLQLQRDKEVAERESLPMHIVQGDMANLNMLADGSFDLIFHPVSNTFVPDVRPVWKEAFRVLRSGGVLLAGFMNPAVYLFDWEAAKNQNTLVVKYRLPYSDERDLPDKEKKERLERGEPMEFSHTLAEQIGGQIEAGFIITSFYEDYETGENDLLKNYMPACIATRSVKNPRPLSALPGSSAGLSEDKCSLD
jgi:SAM-dependent methyltransferase